MEDVHSLLSTVPHNVSIVTWVLAGSIALALISRAAFRFYIYRYAERIAPAAPNTCRIACVGDSITHGMLVRNRRRNSYPAQLEKLLGSRFSVRNFGANARAMQRAADLPYWDHPYFDLSARFQPHVVLIMLGTNDSRKPNWKGVGPYIEDYRAMLAHYGSLPCKPMVYALTPPTEFILKSHKTVHYTMIKEAVDDMTAAIKDLAPQLGIEVIDVNAATSPHPEYFSFDGVHANTKGARHIAETVYAAIRDRMGNGDP